ncbi:MAG: phosphotransferase [Oscillospiraceae bacterium]|nr:phosphotransferase [Oscillospiraceae bacterium]
MPDKKIYDTIVKIEPISKGWSEDKKYCVTTSDGAKYLLRVTPISRYEIRKSLFEMMEQVAGLDIPMCNPVEFGTCDDGVYSLQSWIDGADLEAILPKLSETEQYVLGLKSGEIVRKMHTIPEPEKEVEFLPYRKNWAARFNRKADRNIKMYHDCSIKFDGGETFIKYIEQNRHLLENRPQRFQHGDYHVGNMMIENGELIIVDFDRYDFGDPWEEFNRIVWSAAASPYFATGQIRGYFGGEPPLEFFRLLAFYIASNELASVSWAISFGETETDTMMQQVQDVLNWFDNMNNPVPTWYIKDFHVQYTDGVPYKLKSPFDFSFLKKYGIVFKVYDDQDSGNICFGVMDGENKYFVKFAGAPTERADVSTEEAIANLKRTVPVYRDLAHPLLTKLINAEEIGGGFAMIFEWTDAECMGKQYPVSREKFMQLPIETRLLVFDDILAFHAYAVKRGYVAVDFYDGSIMYDFSAGKTYICDVDFYTKTPYINSMGRMWGSSRFMSPEEFQLGAEIDEITNVYTMGATAFALFGGERDRSLEKWMLSKDLYDAAKRAVSDERSQRQQSISQLTEEWKSAKRKAFK